MTCSIEGCDRPAACKGWCWAHYYRWRRNGDLNTVRPITHSLPAETRFWPKVAGESVEDCWLWMGSRGKHGHGNFTYNGKASYAYRYAYELLIAEIPDGLELDHLCANPPCVNPWHLEPVTPAENKRRMAERTRVTHCPKNHEYSGDNAIYDRNGSRKCKKCRQAYDRKRRPRRCQKPNPNRTVRLL